MGDSRRLIELCAGSAAVSLRWLGQQVPLGWQGGKRAYADAILRAAGFDAFGGRCSDAEVVLCEPGPWGEAWQLWTEGTEGTVDLLRGWAHRDPETLWHELANMPVPSNGHLRVATWAALQFWSFGSKPVLPLNGRWRHHGFHHEGAYRRDVVLTKRAGGLLKYRMGRDQRLPMLADRLRALDLSRVRAVYRSVAEVPLQAGAVTYLDPPYAGTTCAYGHTMSRAMVLDVAITRAKAGELVMISEAEPLDLLGWSAVRLPPPRARGRNNFTVQREEWLTVCPALGTALRLPPAALALPGF